MGRPVAHGDLVPAGRVDLTRGPTPPLASDHLLAAYLAVTGLLAAGTLTTTGWALAAAHAAGVGAVAWVARRPLPAAALPRFLRVFLPVVLTPLLYTELATLNQLVAPGYLDGTVQAWEAAVFGLQPSLAWARAWPWLPLSELLHLGYVSYYLVVPVAAVAVFRGAGDRGLERAAVTVGLAFFVCYLCFAVFPVAGPRYEFARIEGPPAEGPVFALVHGILEAGSSRGTAFPSSHVAAATAALLACRRDARRAFRWLLVPVVLLTLGTVYGRFHYAVDALAGLAVAWAAWAATPWLIATLRSGGGDREVGARG